MDSFHRIPIWIPSHSGYFQTMYRFLNFLETNFSRISAVCAALFVFFLYLDTSDSSVSYWDCPEYVLTSSTLQIGHPPGNPVWTLAMRVATMPFPQELHARVINICSCLLMALAVFFLARIIFKMLKYVLHEKIDKWRPYFWLNSAVFDMVWAMVAFFTAIAFGLLDSTWFSAVEAEVYAFSTFLTAFTIWLMFKWAETTSPSSGCRYLILIAYVLGLSLGVHQLNLLCIPVLALIFVYKRNPDRSVALKAWAFIAGSFLLLGLILLGLMPGAVDWAAGLELLCVNSLGLPYFSGVILYPVFMLIASVGAIIFLPQASKPVSILLLTALFWISGLFLFGSNLLLALLLSLGASLLLTFNLSRRAILTSAWMLIMLWTGYSAVALILVRGYASTPVNEGAPGNIFSLQSYIAREQYGSKPLFYGATPYSMPMREERFTPGDSVPDYSRFALVKGAPRYVPVLKDPHLVYRSRFVTSADSASNKEIASTGHGYLLSDYRFSRVTTPELNMFFPRITSGNPSMLESYADWAGMTRDNMTRVEISTAIDSLGKPVGKLSASGERLKENSLRPTYLQNLRFFLSYQVSYMYLRYLLWNFVGRQNDIPSTGEIDHGNVITGIEPIDRLMVGDQSLMPPKASYENPGRNVYYGIPFLLGLIGIVFLLTSGRKAKRTLAVITLFFLMTGLAIVVYLNQNPGEPRERDYAFIGSYMAFCIWIAFGVVGIAHWIDRQPRLTSRCLILFFIGLGLDTLLLDENFFDHYRHGRHHTRAYALNTLAGKDRDIIFSYGDNFTFPLWYAQEVEGAVPEATIVDVSYLATPEYVINLMKQGQKGLKLTAKPSDIAYGAYAFTRIAPDADTVARPLIDILRDLYSSSEGQPTLKSSRALIPGITMNDTVNLNLRKLATSSGMIPFRTLMLLDIIATNLDSPDPRPLSFLTSVRREVMAPVVGLTKEEAFSDTYAPFMTNDDYRNRLLASTEAIKSAEADFSQSYTYVDPVIQDQIRRQRGGLTRAAHALQNLGLKGEAWEIMSNFPDLYFDASPGSFTVADSTFHETLAAASILIDTLNYESTVKARVLLEFSRKEAEAWRKYYFSLPPDKRPLVSASSRRLITTLPMIDSLSNVADSASRKAFIYEAMEGHFNYLFDDHLSLHRPR